MRRERTKASAFCNTWRPLSVSVFLFIIFLNLFAQTAVASPTIIKKLRIRPSLTETQLIFELSGQAGGKVKYLSKPDRIQVKFTNARKNFNMNNVKLGGSNVKVINAEMLDRDTVQFELMTVGRARWKIESEIKSGVTIFTLKILTTKASSHLIVPERERRMTEDKLVGISRYEKKLEAASVKHRQIVIVVDAGHGGKDPGAVGRSGLQEKEVTLKISKKLAEKINQTPRMRAVLTRQGDHYLTLRQRLQIARTSNADLFMSIHADAYVNKEAAGASIYALSTRGATSEAARWLADRENYSELGNIKLDDLDDSNKLLRSVLIDMSQTVTIRDSLRLGNKVLDALDRVSDLHRNKVEQAPFVVLKSPDIPSILVETGFITNPYEEQRLQQTDYQEKLASALFDGLKSYFTSQYYLHTASLKQVQLVV